MEHKRIITVLICVLVASCVIVSGYVISINRESRYLPDKSVEDIVKILADENISIDPQLISTKTEVGNVYICGSPEEYSSTVAWLIEDCGVRYSFAVPDGDIIIMTNGARFEFGSEFSFRYSENGEEVSLPTRDKLPQMSTPLSEKTKNEISKIAAEFLDRGSESFGGSDHISIITDVENVWENSGSFYAFCTRKIDDTPVSDNAVMCEIKNGKVVSAYGTWSFLTPGESYPAQLTDSLNILFSVKKELAGSGKSVAIESIRRCYSLYTYGEKEELCLIPCWQIVTDNAGEFVYNAIDSTLYTKY